MSGKTSWLLDLGDGMAVTVSVHTTDAGVIRDVVSAAERQGLRLDPTPSGAPHPADVSASPGEIVVYSLLLEGVGASPDGLLHSRIVVEGHEIRCAHKIVATAEGADFASAVIHVNPSSIRFVGLDDELWSLRDLAELTA